MRNPVFSPVMQYGILPPVMTSYKAYMHPEDIFMPQVKRYNLTNVPKIFLMVVLMIVAALLLGGCATGDFGGAGGTNSERRAESLARGGRYADAAEIYIGLASSAQGEERQRLTLLAVEQWLDAGDARRARSALREVPKPSAGNLLWLWNTDSAALHLYDGRPDEALQILEPMSRQALPLQYRSRAEALRADAWFQKGEPKRAVDLYLQRENWLDSPDEIARNRERLWAGLQVGNPQSLRDAADISDEPVMRGWLSLGALAASTGRQGVGWTNGVNRWLDGNPGHPAKSILDDLLIPAPGEVRVPRQIALLLPISGKNSAAGKAIQNGFFAAYFAAAPGLDEVQAIHVYDVENGGVSAAYSKAVQDGAEFVVGPLIRADVETLASEVLLPVPVLALNYLPDEAFAPAGFYQFALAPEDEAASAAARAVADGKRNAVAIYPNNEWGRRVMNSFASEFETSGGRLLDHANYQVGTQDFSLEIEGLMGLSHSVSRYKRLRANLDEPLQFDPRRRQDVDFVFLAADSKAGRLIKSQLKFHYAGELPVYSTSFIYSMDGRSNSDLNGIMFADVPWIISPPPWIAGLPELFDEFWPAEKRMGRLHAMGYDSYQLVVALFSSGDATQVSLAGATGELSMDTNGRVRRRLPWAQFRRGEPVAIPSAPSIDVLINGNMADQSGQPTEWRLHQPSR